MGAASRHLPWLCSLLLMTGCAALWEGELERADHRNIYLYEVEEGDTLSRIAWRHGLSVEQLQAWNEIGDPRQLQVGAHLVLNPPAGFDGEVGGDAATDTRVADADSEPEGTGETREPPPPPEDMPDHELDWAWPAEGPVKRAYATDSGGKSGIQIGGSEGDTVRAAEGGEVVYSGSGLQGYGNLIIIMHDDRYLSAYGYNRELLVDEGDRVGAGDPVAEMGHAPGAESASLHFEIRVDGDAVDPEAHLPARE